MGTFGILWATFAVLNGIFFDDTAPFLTQVKSASFNDRFVKNLALSEGGVENSTIYYAFCDRNGEQTKECTLRRTEIYSRAGNECNITLRSESGGMIQTRLIAIDRLGEDRAIVRWFEKIPSPPVKYHMRFSVVNFSNCQVKTTKLSEDLDQLIVNVNDHKRQFKNFSDSDDAVIKEFNKLRYLKGEDDFEVVSAVGRKVYRSSIDAEGFASPVDTLFTYPTESLIESLIVPLSKDEGYLFIETSFHSSRKKILTTITLIQSNGQRKNLTHIESAYPPLVSIANGLIGLCSQPNEITMKCTQFKLGEHKDIEWFTAVTGEDFGPTRVIHNLPEGQGFLAFKDVTGASPFTDGKHLVKIGLDGRPTRLTYAGMTTCFDNQEAISTKLFNDDMGHYGLSVACMKTFNGLFTTSKHSSYLQFKSKMFGPKNSDQVIKETTNHIRINFMSYVRLAFT